MGATQNRERERAKNKKQTSHMINSKRREAHESEFIFHYFRANIIGISKLQKHVIIFVTCPSVFNTFVSEKNRPFCKENPFRQPGPRFHAQTIT